jgi:hypothetical protein
MNPHKLKKKQFWFTQVLLPLWVIVIVRQLIGR